MLKNQRRILLIDDDIDLATLLVDCLTLEGFEVVPTHCGSEGLDAANRGPFDLIIIDDAASGLTTLSKLREVSRTPVLMLTQGMEQSGSAGALKADAVITKPCPPREITQKINSILQQSADFHALSAPILVGPVVINPAAHSISSDFGPIELTGTEFALFELLARNVGGPVPKEEIYPKVLGRPMGPFDRAIDVHISAIRHKITKVIGQRLAIESIRGVGYRLVVKSTD